MDPVRVGIIGCGVIAFMKHMPALSRNHAAIVATYDPRLENASRAAKEFGTPDAVAYDECDALLTDERVEAVYVLTPNRFHADLTCRALRAGKHVLCEKPMAETYEDALRMLEARDASGKHLTIGYQYRQLPENRYLKRECEAGALGDIYYAKALAVRRRGVPTWGTFFSREAQGGGVLIDVGTHALDLALYMMDNYEPAYCVGTTYCQFSHAEQPGNRWGDWDGRHYDVEDAAFGLIVMRNGATVYLESSWALNTLQTNECKVVLCGTKGGADTLDGLRLNGVKHNTQYVLRPDFAATGDSPLAAKQNEDDRDCEIFLRAIRGEGTLCVKAEQAATVTRILQGIYRSAATGKVFEFTD